MQRAEGRRGGTDMCPGPASKAVWSGLDIMRHAWVAEAWTLGHALLYQRTGVLVRCAQVIAWLGLQSGVWAARVRCAGGVQVVHMCATGYTGHAPCVVKRTGIGR